jgi:hypothetical protein
MKYILSYIIFVYVLWIWGKSIEGHLNIIIGPLGKAVHWDCYLYKLITNTNINVHKIKYIFICFGTSNKINVWILKKYAVHNIQILALVPYARGATRRLPIVPMS